MNCVTCGAGLSPSQLKCPKCNTPVGAAPAVTEPAPAAAYKQCPQCGFAAAAAVQQCPQCGHKYRTQFKPAEEPQKPINRTTTVGCADCGSSNVQKLTSMGRDSGMELPGGVRPPVRPTYSAPPVMGVALGCGVLFAVSLVALAVTGVGNTMVVVLAATLGAAALITGLLAQQEVAAAKAKQLVAESRFEEAMRQWNLLFYCAQCGKVYNISTRQSVPASSTQSLLTPV